MGNGVEAKSIEQCHVASSVNREPLEPLNDGRLRPMASLGLLPMACGVVPRGVDGARGLGRPSVPPGEVTGVRAGPGRMTATSLSLASALALRPWRDGPADGPAEPRPVGDPAPP